MIYTFQLLFNELLTLFLTWLNQISISSELLAQFNPSLDTKPGVNVEQMVKKKELKRMFCFKMVACQSCSFFAHPGIFKHLEQSLI